MIVERNNNEILIRISAAKNIDEIQDLINYLRYEELTAQSTANDEDAQKLHKEAKKGRLEKSKRYPSDK